MKITIKKYSQNFLSLSSAWCTPCTILKVESFFSFFSLDQWICFPTSLIFAAITVICISNYEQKSRLHESKTYSTIFSVCKHTAQFCTATSVLTRWVCYSVAINTEFQAYLNTFLTEPGYKNYKKSAKNIKFRYDVRFPSNARHIFYWYFKIYWIRLF